VFVDLGYRGVDQDNPEIEIIHRGKFRSLSKQQRRWLRRRQTIEPTLGHMKQDHRLDRCWLQGSLGDALHAVLCAAGYNLRWLMRAVLRRGLKALFFALIVWSARARRIAAALLRQSQITKSVFATAAMPAAVSL
jgi:IS5 family transposase